MSEDKDRRKTDEVKDLMKQAWKESINEWLDAKYAAFGKWTLVGILAFIFALIIHVWLMFHANDLKRIADTTIDQLAK